MAVGEKATDTRPHPEPPFKSTVIETAGKGQDFETFRWTNDEILSMQDRSKVFYTDNHTKASQDRRDRWYQNYGERGVIVAMLCSDARERVALPTDDIIDLSTIAASGPTEPYAKMLNYPRTRAFVNASHFDSDKWQSGTMLLGCGGLGARAEAERSNATNQPSTGLVRYVNEDIRDKDAVYNSIKNGAIAAAATNRPVLAGVHDHKYGTFTPVAYMEGKLTLSEVALGELMDPNRYDPKRLYSSEDGTLQLPRLETADLPPVFREFLEKQQEHIAQLQEEYPNLPEILAEQNPQYLFITTEKVPTRIRYPHTLSDPGSFFQIHIPRGKDETGLHIDTAAIERAVAQAEYPVDHARFSNLHTIIIESGSLAQSKIIAEALGRALRNIEEDHADTHPYDTHEHREDESNSHVPWLKTWLQNPQNQVLIAQSNSGRTTQIEKHMFSS
jgi:hypothetical protein